MIKAFQSLLGEKRNEVDTLKNKYSNGYQTLITTEEKVNDMKQELIDMQPKLIETAKEVSEQTIIVQEKTTAAEIVKQGVAKEEAIAQEAADEATAIKTDCENELAKALPALAKATKALDAISAGDVAEMKGNRSPLPAVVLVMTTVAILFEIPPESKMDPTTQKKVQNYWPPVQKFMGQMGFLDQIKGYNKDSLNEAKINKLQPYITQEMFNPEKLQTVNKVAANFAVWVLAMDGYYRVNLIVIPKREELKVAQAKYDKISGELKIAQAKLKKVQDEVAEL